MRRWIIEIGLIVILTSLKLISLSTAGMWHKIVTFFSYGIALWVAITIYVDIMTNIPNTRRLLGTSDDFNRK